MDVTGLVITVATIITGIAITLTQKKYKSVGHGIMIGGVMAGIPITLMGTQSMAMGELKASPEIESTVSSLESGFADLEKKIKDTFTFGQSTTDTIPT